jgi:hypothetical protein
MWPDGPRRLTGENTLGTSRYPYPQARRRVIRVDARWVLLGILVLSAAIVTVVFVAGLSLLFAMRDYIQTVRP